MMRWRRLSRLAPQFLAASIRRDWPLAALALVSLAPGVAALVAWMQIAWRVRSETLTPAQFLALYQRIVGADDNGNKEMKE